MSAGIDYGMGRTNIDTATGIRYGVISQHSLAEWFYDEFQSEYGEPHCPECGNEVQDCRLEDLANTEGGDEYEHYGRGCADYVCHACKHTLDSADVFPDEPIGHSLDTNGYKAIDCLDSDVMVLASPFYTYGPFCSPCVPGAVNLNGAVTPFENSPVGWEATDGSDGVKAYCFGHDWFDSGKAPYRVFRVSDDTEVLPDVR